MSRIDRVLDRLREALAPSGMNLVGAAAVTDYDATVPAAYALERLLPGAVSAIVIGNGGGDLWHAFAARREPGPHPLDAFTRRVIETAALPLITAAAGEVRVVYPFAFPVDPVSFMRLAACAGLGRPSLLGVLIHPRFGPWIALRAAILVRVAVAAPRPADGFDPCPTCRERACMPACPAGAVTAAGWDIPRCAAHRRRVDDPCAARCHARVDCVVGREHRYPEAALAYHQERARAALLGR